MFQRFLNALTALLAWSADHPALASAVLWPFAIGLCNFAFKPKTAEEYAKIAKVSPRLAGLLQLLGTLGIDPNKAASVFIDKIVRGNAYLPPPPPPPIGRSSLTPDAPPPTTRPKGSIRTALVFPLGLALSLPVTTSGCAMFSSVASVLPDVIAAVTDGSQILDEIERFANVFFAAHPDDDMRAKVATALSKARTALNVALRVAQGSKDVDDARVDQAFEEFKEAYLELLALTRPMGVRPSGSPSARFARSGVGLQVPEPIAFRSTWGKQR